MSEEITAAEKRGYAKGYNAGIRANSATTRHHIKKISELEHEIKMLSDSFVTKAFLAALPAVIASNWNCGIKNTAESKVQAAWHFAKAALKERF